MSIAVLELHPARSRQRRLEGGAIIGRASRCDVHLDDPLVSRRHARVMSFDVGMAIEDLGSSNGLYVNGRPAPGVTALHPGDVVQLGGTFWLVLSREA
jgi:pSer/pThr/pTyr-binding forkhead associated (FHA) protein